MKKLVAFLMLVCLLTGCGATPSDIQYQPYDKPYIQTYCTDLRATTEIAVKDGKVYCAYYETNDSDYVIDVFEDNEWHRVEAVTGSLFDHPLFRARASYSPLHETIGDHTLYSSEDHTLYLASNRDNIHFDLGWGAEDWRRVATDHENTFAVLSAQMFTVDGKQKAELRIYTIE